MFARALSINDSLLNEESTNTNDEKDQKWSPERADIVIESSAKTLMDNVILLSKYENAESLDDQQFRSILLKINKQYSVMKDVPASYSNKLVIAQVKSFLDSGFIPMVVKLFKRLSDEWLSNKIVASDGKLDYCYFRPVRLILNTLSNYSDHSEEFGCALVKEQIYLDYLTRYILEFREGFVQNTLTKKLCSLLKCVIICGYNLMLHENPECLRRVRESDMVEAVKSYLNFDINDNTFMIQILLFLAYSVDEKQAELFLSKRGTINYYISLLKKSLTTAERRAKGYSTEELAKGVERLAKNDINKRQLVEQGILFVLRDLVKSKIPRECELAYLIIWTLTFDNQNKEQILGEKSALLLDMSCHERTFENVDKSEDTFSDSIVKAEKARLGALWTLQSEDYLKRNDSNSENILSELQSPDQDSKKAKKSFASKKKRSSLKSQTTPQHVMLSYSWAQKAIILRLANELKKKDIPVWLDVDEMQKSDNTLDAMANAVEHSSCVIISMSEAYKTGQNTRAEAEYAYKRRKQIIPIVVEPKYRPDGWLGLMVGTKLYYDFTGKYPFDQKLSELLVALSADNSWHESTNNSELTSTKPSNRSLDSCDGNTVISKWSNDDVRNWAQNNNLLNIDLTDVTGEHLVFLKRIQRESYDYFYRCLENQLNIKTLDSTMRFVKAFDQLETLK